MKALTLLVLLTTLFAACSREPVIPPVTNLTPSEKSAKIIAADNRFGFELLSKVNSDAPNQQNLMISPMSVSLALAMLYNGAEGDTRQQMQDMFHKSGLGADDVNQSYKELVSGLESHDPKVELSMANAIFYRNDFSVKANFISTNQIYYSAEVAGLDFSNPVQSLQTVNGWVNEKTKGKISKIINQVSPDDVMYLLNAIYFKGQWTCQFDKGLTANRPFTKSDNSVIQVQTMNIESDFNFYGTDDFQLLEMPYGGGKFSMLIFLPETGKTVNDVIAQLSSDRVNDWISKLTSQKKQVYLPKFEFRFDKSLIETLKALGMTDAFDGRANLSGISDVAQLVVTEVMHKTYIKVDEAGTEAAAVTGITVGYTSVNPQSNIFRVDHPFVFAIREKDTGALLFVGKVMDPGQS
jgi:serpin B